MLIGVVPADSDGAAADLLRAAGCGRIVPAVALDRLVAPGDVVVVGRLADLGPGSGSGLAELVARLAALAGRGIGFRSLAERLDSAAADGAARLALALAGLDRAFAGAAAVRRRRGRPPSLDGRGRARARALLAAELPADQVAAVLGVSRATLYRHLRAASGPGPGSGLGPGPGSGPGLGPG